MTLEQIQSKLQVLKETASKLEAQIQGGKARRALRLDVAANWLTDVERLYIPSAQNPALPANSRMFLELAEFSLAHAEAVLIAAEKMHQDHGGSLNGID